MTSEERISRYSQKLNSLSKILNKKFPNLKNKELDKFLHYEHAFMMVFRVLGNCMKKKRFLVFHAITNFFSNISRKIEIIRRLLAVFDAKKGQILKEYMKRWRKKCTFRCERRGMFRKKINMLFFIKNLDFLKSAFYKLRIFSLLSKIKDHNTENKTSIRNSSENFSQTKEEYFTIKLSEILNKKFNNPISSARAFYRIKEFSIRKFELVWILCDNLKNYPKKMLRTFFAKCHKLKFATKKMTKLFKTIEQKSLKLKEAGFQRIHVFSNFHWGFKYVSPKNVRIKFFTKILDKIVTQHKQELHGSFIEKINKKREKSMLMALLKILKKLEKRLLNNSFNKMNLVRNSNKFLKNTSSDYKRGFEKIYRTFSRISAFKKIQFLYDLKFQTKFYSKNQKNINLLNLIVERIFKNRKVYALKKISFILFSRFEKGKILCKNLNSIYGRKMQRAMSILYANDENKKKNNKYISYRNQFFKMIAILSKLLIIKIKGETFHNLKIFDYKKSCKNAIKFNQRKEQSLGLKSLLTIIKSSLKTSKSEFFKLLKVEKYNKAFLSKEKIRSSLSLITIFHKCNRKNIMYFLKKLKNYSQDRSFLQNKIRSFMSKILEKIKQSKKYFFIALKDKERKISKKAAATKKISKILNKLVQKKLSIFLKIISQNFVINRKINEFHKKTITINKLEILLSNNLSIKICETFDALKLKSNKFEYGIYLFNSFNESVQEKLMRKSLINLRKFNKDETYLNDEPNIFTKIHDELNIVTILPKNKLFSLIKTKQIINSHQRKFNEKLRNQIVENANEDEELDQINRRKYYGSYDRKVTHFNLNF